MWKPLLAAATVLPLFTPLLAQSSSPTPAPGDWPMYSHDLAGTRYSPLTQINAKNVSKLQPAWTYHLRTDAERNAAGGGGVAGFSEVTPIVVNGVMYLTAGKRVVALNPDTGAELWTYTLTGAGNPSNRGVSYWPGDKSNPPRIIFTAGSRMLALNAKTGKIDPGFGKEGEVALGTPYNSPPTIFGNSIFVGANVPEQPATGQPGNTRAYDARTGAKSWEFHSVPQPGEPGNESWQGDDWKGRTGVNNWGFYMTVDAQRNLLYTTFGSPASDFYGFDRPGDDLFGNSVVALDITTGKMKWFFQAVHHDLWDMDLPPSPPLLDVMINGKKTPILAQTGKLGYMFILNRETGKPVFGVKETPVPQSKVPGEHTSATQPIPIKPKELSTHNFKMEDLVTAADTNEEHAKACQELVAKAGPLYNEGPFTPWVYRAPGTPPQSSIIFPGAIGGNDWGGSSTDPKLGYVFVNTSNYASFGWLEKMPDNARVPYDQRSVFGNPVASKFWDRKTDASGALLGEQSWPCQKPPWGLLTAVNAATGEFAWQVRLGVTDELPEGKRNTGRVNLGGSIATAGGLVFIGASNDKRFRAFDSKTGKELWITKLDYSAISVPITYAGKGGKQYVAISASGGGAITSPNASRTESLYVFALP
ncbi:MAG TPA: PQQ-binding-like beta-propeller repeat protein [Bryobacteraceae bacterium]